MTKSCLALLTLLVVSGCGTLPSPSASQAGARGLVASAAADADKHAIAPPKPLPLRQGFTVHDAASIAADAYRQIYNTASPTEAQQDARVALQKIQALVPASTLATQVVPYAQAMLKTRVASGENARRLALWPMLYISNGLTSSDDPRFFELAAKTMQSMLSWQDGLTVGISTMSFLSDSSNGYVKTMAEKAFADYRNPKTNTQAAYQLMLSTMNEIGATLAATKR